MRTTIELESNNPIKNPPICVEPERLRRQRRREREREKDGEKRGNPQQELTIVLIHFLHAHSVTSLQLPLNIDRAGDGADLTAFSVLKGHIALGNACFLNGTNGHALDILARIPSWKDGLGLLIIDMALVMVLDHT
ncbi:hypothetical protein NC653_040514 [Populus alba x Populus x berolinensis]|uniref:Uncharacterized protein n=1 Tax=Populus alba x Populus x berolinensis TaxID=444605 RepID=A0AAD6PNY7_9ROSI|nr:hypothetical protein NC653_040514 [Populus alba x Populus x berolinensis]